MSRHLDLLKLAALGVLISGVSLSSAAMADPTVPQGSAGFNVSNASSGVVGYTPADAPSITSINFSNVILNFGANSATNGDGSTNVLHFTGGAGGTANSDSAVATTLSTTSSSPAFTLSDAASLGILGTFTANGQGIITNQTLTGSGANRSASETIFVAGTLAGGSAESGQTLTASITLNLNETGPAGSSIALSGTIFTPAVFPTIPEPASLALLGTGILGLGMLRRRKK